MGSDRTVASPSPPPTIATLFIPLCALCSGLWAQLVDSVAAPVSLSPSSIPTSPLRSNGESAHPCRWVSSNTPSRSAPPPLTVSALTFPHLPAVLSTVSTAGVGSTRCAATALVWSGTSARTSPASTRTSSGQPSTPHAEAHTPTHTSPAPPPPHPTLPSAATTLALRLSPHHLPSDDASPLHCVSPSLGVRVPKPLIPVDGRPLINHWLELLTAAGVPKSDVFVVTNQHFYPHFSKWAQDHGVGRALLTRTHRTTHTSAPHSPPQSWSPPHCTAASPLLSGLWSASVLRPLSAAR